MTATRADVERAVSGRPGRRPRNGRVWDGDVRARSRRWFKACVPDDEIPGPGGGAARESTPPRLAARARLAAGGSLRPPTRWMARWRARRRGSRPGVDGRVRSRWARLRGRTISPGGSEGGRGPDDQVRELETGGGRAGWSSRVGNRGWEPHVRMKEEVAVSGEPAGRATWGPVAGRLRRWDRVAGALRSDERGPIGGEAT